MQTGIGYMWIKMMDLQEMKNGKDKKMKDNLELTKERLNLYSIEEKMRTYIKKHPSHNFCKKQTQTHN